LAASGLVELGVELLAPPLGELALLLLEELGLLGLLAPPEADPDLGVSLEADPLMPPEDELDEDGLEGLDEAPPDGDEDEDELLGEDGELLGEVELEEPEVLLASPRSHAARPRARATAIAMAESFICPPWVGINRESSKLRAQPKPLIPKGLSRARGTLCLLDAEVLTCCCRWSFPSCSGCWGCCSGSRTSWKQCFRPTLRSSCRWRPTCWSRWETMLRRPRPTCRCRDHIP